MERGDLEALKSNSGGRKARPYEILLFLLGRGGVYPRPKRTDSCSSLVIGTSQTSFASLCGVLKKSGKELVVIRYWSEGIDDSRLTTADRRFVETASLRRLKKTKIDSIPSIVNSQ